MGKVAVLLACVVIGICLVQLGIEYSDALVAVHRLAGPILISGGAVMAGWSLASLLKSAHQRRSVNIKE
jgi:arginine exporter protein ArgO